MTASACHSSRRSFPWHSSTLTIIASSNLCNGWDEFLSRCPTSGSILELCLIFFRFFKRLTLLTDSILSRPKCKTWDTHSPSSSLKDLASFPSRPLTFLYSELINPSMTFSRILAALVAIVATRRAFAQIVATGPGPNETYLAGSPCNITWNIDTSGTWNNMSIGEYYIFHRDHFDLDTKHLSVRSHVGIE